MTSRINNSTSRIWGNRQDRAGVVVVDGLREVMKKARYLQSQYARPRFFWAATAATAAAVTRRLQPALTGVGLIVERTCSTISGPHACWHPVRMSHSHSVTATA